MQGWRMLISTPKVPTASCRSLRIPIRKFIRLATLPDLMVMKCSAFRINLISIKCHDWILWILLFENQPVCCSWSTSHRREVPQTCFVTEGSSEEWREVSENMSLLPAQSIPTTNERLKTSWYFAGCVGSNGENYPLSDPKTKLDFFHLHITHGLPLKWWWTSVQSRTKKSEQMYSIVPVVLVISIVSGK